MTKIKAIQTRYNGYLFRSRLEARWAVFFDACGVEWEYEPEGYDLGDGMFYLPDFLLHGVVGRSPSDLFVEVKGVMADEDAAKIKKFVELGTHETDETYLIKTPILIVGNIPSGDIFDYIQGKAYEVHENSPNEFNFETIDGDYFGAYPGINRSGKFELFGDTSWHQREMNREATKEAYRIAREARFEYGETPRLVGYDS